MFSIGEVTTVASTPVPSQQRTGQGEVTLVLGEAQVIRQDEVTRQNVVGLMKSCFISSDPRTAFERLVRRANGNEWQSLIREAALCLDTEDYATSFEELVASNEELFRLFTDQEIETVCSNYINPLFCEEAIEQGRYIFINRVRPTLSQAEIMRRIAAGTLDQSQPDLTEDQINVGYVVVCDDLQPERRGSEQDMIDGRSDQEMCLAVDITPPHRTCTATEVFGGTCPGMQESSR